MSTLINRILVVGMVLASLTRVWSFSMHGPKEAYHIGPLGYSGDFYAAPKNLDDEYRLNLPKLFYAIDGEFISYFGTNGIAAIDGATAMLNDLPGVNDPSLSPDLSGWPLKSWGVNYTAQALSLFDLQSCTLEVLVERYGLTDPEEFTWTLRNRHLPGGAQCPNYLYGVIKRNFDPITLLPSSYVNGNLFTYQILEFCPGDDSAIAFEYLVDPLGTELTAVASSKLLSANSGYLGYFHQSLTRDDIGGIRYLLSTNNVNWETTPVDSIIYNTNTTQPVLLFPSNLHVFAEQALTNDAGTLAGLYPGLLVTGTSNYFVNVVSTNITTYLTNPPFAPADAPPVLAFRTNLTTNVAVRYVHEYGNILTFSNMVYSNCFTGLLTTNIGPAPYAPADSGILVTNVTLETTLKTNCVSGSLFILPADICGYQILSTQLTTLVLSTNLLTNTLVTFTLSNTNQVGGTNQTGNTNLTQYYEFSQSRVTYFTNQILVAYPIQCPESITSLFEGAQKVEFVKREYDSLLGQFFVPVTNTFEMTEITNFHRVTRFVERTIFTPDILFSADDLILGPTDLPADFTVSRQVPNYVSATNVTVLGPGTIQPNISFTFNKIGPFFVNFGPAFIDEATAELQYIWGSFDGTTNAPVVYPVGTDLMDLENVMVFQLTSPSVRTNGVYLLPDGSVGDPYNGSGFQLEANGGLPPYTWFEPGDSGLPVGMALYSHGLLTGTPAVAGIYDLSIRLKDAADRSITFPFTLTVSP